MSAVHTITHGSEPDLPTRSPEGSGQSFHGVTNKPESQILIFKTDENVDSPPRLNPKIRGSSFEEDKNESKSKKDAGK